MLNAKNVPADSTLCIVRLATLEAMVAARESALDKLLAEMGDGDINELLAGIDNTELDKLIAETDSGLDELLADIAEQAVKWEQTLGVQV
jgi:hypothetical protein